MIKTVPRLPLSLLLFFTFAAVPAVSRAPVASSLDALRPNQSVEGFRATAIYLDDQGKPMGARFIHQRTGFQLDLLRIESAPQAFIWVDSLPVSDKGEPHTQEHLLLGKGNKGRAVANLDEMSLTSSTAFTAQWRTCFHFHTDAGPAVFFEVLHRHLDALLHPDYTDEEIRREVRNFGVDEAPGHTLRLDEKGTVYNEMVSTFQNPGSRLFRVLDTELYGADHPLTFVAGGTPEALRTITPADIRRFHNAAYHLNNMGMIAALPSSMPLLPALHRLNAMMDRMDPASRPRPGVNLDNPKMPPAHSAPAAEIRIVPYPDRNEQQPGDVVFAWPPTRHLSPVQQSLLSLFLDNVASDATTNLYQRFVNSQTRVMDTGATAVYGWESDDEGHPVMIGLSNVRPSHMNERELSAIRAVVTNELQRIASWKDGSAELVEFNRRMATRVIAWQRDLSKLLNSPPGFGYRGRGGEWMGHLRLLSETGRFDRSVTLRPEAAEINILIRGRHNIWPDLLRSWGLLDVTPYAAAAKPDPALLASEEQKRQDRIQAETVRLEHQYTVADPQEALRRYEAEYNRDTAVLDALAKQTPRARFISDPPLTVDDSLQYRVSQIGGVPIVTSTFDNMTSATTGLALRLNGVTPDLLPYLALLPDLLTQTGVIEKGQPVSFEQTQERMRREILGLGASFSTNPHTGRAELVLTGAGNNPAESQRAIHWMEDVLYHPDWQEANLPRLRDLVDQDLAALRTRRQAPEEYWVSGVATAYWQQGNPLYLATSSFLTQEHDALMLRWELQGGSAADRSAAGAFLTRLAGAGASATRDDLKELLGAIRSTARAPARSGAPGKLQQYVPSAHALPAGAANLVRSASSDLDETLSEIPDNSLAADWSSLCQEMARDLSVGPAAAVHRLEALRRLILRRGGARLFQIGSQESQARLRPSVSQLLSGLTAVPVTPFPYPHTALVLTRLRQRDPTAANPHFVGLLNPNTEGGVFLNSAPGPGYGSTDRESLLRALSFSLFGGGGADSIFMKTWGAGLAYSNGLGSNLAWGRFSYYAERCPDLPQTLQFVIDQLASASHDPWLAEYATALQFGSRMADEYEARGSAMAADLADGLTPTKIRRFRLGILKLRHDPNLAGHLFRRMILVYTTVLPGMKPHWTASPGAVDFIIGPAKQFASYQAYLHGAVGPSTTLYELYPRDFWRE